jgi:hypothetical protein
LSATRIQDAKNFCRREVTDHLRHRIRLARGCGRRPGWLGPLVLVAGLPLANLQVAAGRGEVLRMPDEPVPDDAAGLRAANARLRELLAERYARIEELVARLAAVGSRWRSFGGRSRT